MRRRIMASVGKPLPYLRRVAYLESHGTEFIDTGYIFPENAGRIVADFQWTGSTNGNIVWGAQESRDTNWAFNQYSSSWYIGSSNVGNADFYLNDGIRKNVDIRGYFGNYEIYLNGVLKKSGNYTGTVSNQEKNTISIWADNNGVQYLRPSKCRVYSFDIFDSPGNANRSVGLIPVLDLSGRPAMYDEVSGNLFYNQGTGEFTWGELGTELAGGGYKCVRRSWRSASRRSRHFSRWEVAA